jgi:hypothetical protein
MYIPSQFFNKSKAQVEYLIVGGGGAGGFFTFINGIPNTYAGPAGGGGGAGGFVSGTIDLLLGNAYPIQVGTGGIDVGNDATNGGDTKAFGLTAYGGGSGGEQISLYDFAGPGAGASGGGGCGNQTTTSGSAIYGSQGNDGGIGALYLFLGNGVYSGGGGGGGASVKGANAAQIGGSLGRIQGGAGGNGKAWSDGKYYSGGGGGGSWSTSTTSLASATGGIGGGGQGGSKGFGTAVSGSPNTGGGGGGGEGVRNGGSGIVKVRYPATSIADIKFIGGQTTFSSSYIYHIFTTSSILYTYKPAEIPTASVSTTIDFLIVGGGGGGGSVNGGGGGAGGYISYTDLINAGSYTVIVGNGGTGGNDGTNGQNSSIFSIVANGGGRGGSGNTGEAGGIGGSGGGTNCNGGLFNGGAASGSTLFPSQGNSGGGSNISDRAGGGGGAGQVGGPSYESCQGGDGLQWLDGNYYAGGGGGQWYADANNGGRGGGGRGEAGSPATSGTPNTGGGGGGGNGSVGNGGSGVVKLRYVSGSIFATGGNIEVSGSYVYHTFTSSSTFAF